jgi:hypothetical protein
VFMLSMVAGCYLYVSVGIAEMIVQK